MSLHRGTKGIRLGFATSRAPIILATLALATFLLSGYGQRRTGPINPRDVETRIVQIEAPSQLSNDQIRAKLGSTVSFAGRDSSGNPQLFFALGSEQVAPAIVHAGIRQNIATLSSPILVRHMALIPGVLADAGGGALWLTDSPAYQLMKVSSGTGEILEKFSFPASLQGSVLAGLQVVPGTETLVAMSQDPRTPDNRHVPLVEFSLDQKMVKEWIYRLDQNRFSSTTPVQVQGLAALAPHQFLVIERGKTADGRWSSGIYFAFARDIDGGAELEKFLMLDLSSIEWGEKPIAAVTMMDDGRTLAISSGLGSPQAASTSLPIDLWLISLPGPLVSSALFGYVSAAVVVLISVILLWLGLATKPPYVRNHGQIQK